MIRVENRSGEGYVYRSNQACLLYLWTHFSPLHSQFFCNASEPGFLIAPDHNLFLLNCYQPKDAF